LLGTLHSYGHRKNCDFKQVSSHNLRNSLQNENTKPLLVVWWHMPIIPALGRLRQKDSEFEVILDYIVRTCLKKNKKRKKRKSLRFLRIPRGVC
jgi:hypothetical protein